MFSFSFDKRSKDSIKKDTPIETEKVQYITKFSEKNEDSEKRKFNQNEGHNKNSKSKLRKYDFKEYKDEDIIPSDISMHDVAKLVTNTYRNIDINEVIPSNKSFYKGLLRPKNSIKTTMARIVLVKDDLCKVVHGKYKGMIGTVLYVSDDDVRLRIQFSNNDRVMIDVRNVEKISKKFYDELFHEEELRQRKKEMEYSMKKKELEAQQVKVIPKRELSDWLLSGMHVRITDKNYLNGKYQGQSTMILDIDNEGECSCITSSGEQLSGITCRMLTPTRPVVESKARIVDGHHKGHLVNVLEINESAALVEVPFTDDTWDIDVDCLCLCEY